jgi:hypothetical protein
MTTPPAGPRGWRNLGEQPVVETPWFRLRGPEADFEAERIEWIPLTDAPALISGGQVKDASTAAALLWLHASMPRIEP